MSPRLSEALHVAPSDEAAINYAAERLRYFYPKSIGDKSITVAIVAIGAYLEHRAANAEWPEAPCNAVCEDPE